MFWFSGDSRSRTYTQMLSLLPDSFLFFITDYQRLPISPYPLKRRVSHRPKILRSVLWVTLEFLTSFTLTAPMWLVYLYTAFVYLSGRQYFKEQFRFLATDLLA